MDMMSRRFHPSPGLIVAAMLVFGPAAGAQSAPSTVVVSGTTGVSIQVAIDSLNGSPGTVLVPAGVFTLNQSLFLHTGQRLEGVGASLPSAAFQPASTILQYDPAPGSTGPGNPPYAIVIQSTPTETVRWVEVRNLSITGAPKDPPARGGILLDDVDNCIIESVYLEGFYFGDPVAHEQVFQSVATLPDTELGTGITVRGSSYFNQIRNCRIHNANAHLLFEDGANSNVVLGRELAGACNSSVAILECNDVKVIGASIEADTTFSNFELRGGSHCSFIGNRVEVSTFFTWVPGSNWHVSLLPSSGGKSSQGNWVHNPFATNKLGGETGTMHVDHPSGLEGRTLTINPVPVRLDPRIDSGTGKAVYRFSVLGDWDRESAFEYDVFFKTGGSGAGQVQFEAVTRGYQEGDADEAGHASTSAGVAVSAGPPDRRWRDRIPSFAPPSPNPVDATAEYVELELTRNGPLDTYAGSAAIELVVVRYRAILTRIHVP